MVSRVAAPCAAARQRAEGSMPFVRGSKARSRPTTRPCRASRRSAITRPSPALTAACCDAANARAESRVAVARSAPSPTACARRPAGPAPRRPASTGGRGRAPASSIGTPLVDRAEVGIDARAAAAETRPSGARARRRRRSRGRPRRRRWSARRVPGLPGFWPGSVPPPEGCRRPAAGLSPCRRRPPHRRRRPSRAEAPAAASRRRRVSRSLDRGRVVVVACSEGRHVVLLSRG